VIVDTMGGPLGLDNMSRVAEMPVLRFLPSISVATACLHHQEKMATCVRAAERN
jgi:hypothetical protein